MALKAGRYGVLHSGRFFVPTTDGFIESLVLGLGESVDDAVMQFVHYYHRLGLTPLARAEIVEGFSGNLSTASGAHDTRTRTNATVDDYLRDRGLIGRDTRQ